MTVHCATQSVSLPGIVAGAYSRPGSVEPSTPAGYDRRLFVAPGPVYQRVLDKLQKWKELVSDGSPQYRYRVSVTRCPQPLPVDHVLRLVGEHGVGKTWLLRHLGEREDLAQDAVYIDLLKRNGFGKPEDFCNAVRQQVYLQCGARAAILLLDNVPLFLDDHLRLLEDTVLLPYLLQMGMVIMALSHPARDGWRAPILRGGETLWLRSFGQSGTRSQLEALERAGRARVQLRAATIQDRSGGLPLLNFLLGQFEEGLAFERFLAYIFAQIPARDRATVRSYLDAVCVLESLEHAAIDRTLRVYHRWEPWAGGTLPHAGKVRNVLREHWLARSAPDLPGRIVLVESVRRAAREILQVRAPGLYVAMNESAYGARREQP